MNNIGRDLDRYFFPTRASSLWEKAKIVVLTQGIWAICIYRFGSYVYQKDWYLLFRKPLMLLATILQKFIEILTGISISFSTQIGPGFYIGHFGGIFIHKNVRIGEHCNVSQGVSIGLGGRGTNMGVPTVGDRVYIGPNAVILGKITIGNDAAVGANAVVTRPVPDNAIVAGVPAKIINYSGSGDFVVFRTRTYWQK